MEKPNYTFPSENSPAGNIFCILGDVLKLLPQKQRKELTHRILHANEAHSYNEAKDIIREYVNASN